MMQPNPDNAATLAEAYPLEGIVFLDLDEESGEQVLTHTLLLQRWATPSEGRPWEMVFADGVPALVSQWSDAVRFLQDFLPMQVFRQDSELIVLETVDRAGKRMLERWSLGDRMRQHQVRSCLLRIDADEVEFEVYHLRRPRCAAHLMWSAFALSKHFELKSYMGQPSKWTYNAFGSWVSIVPPVGMKDSLVRPWQGPSPKPSCSRRTGFSQFPPSAPPACCCSSSGGLGPGCAEVGFATGPLPLPPAH